MVRYDFKCNTCDVQVEVELNEMKLPRDMSDKELDMIRCPNKDCANFGEIMSKDWSKAKVNLLGFSGGSSMNEKGLLAKKQAAKKLRSKKHFKREILPDLNETPKIMDHFKKKFKDI